MKKNTKGALLALSAGALWGGLGITVRMLAGCGLSAMQIVALRFCMATLLLGLFITATDRRKFHVEKKDWKLLLLLGLGCILVFNTAYTITIGLTTLSTASLLLYTSPVWATLLSVPVCKEKLTGRKVLAICLCFCGLVLMSGILTGAPAVTALGLATGLLAGVGYGCYGVFGKLLMERYHPLTTTFYTFALAGIGGMLLCNPAEAVFILREQPKILVMLLLAALVCVVAPYLLYNMALSRMEASRAAVIVAVEPVSAAICGWIVYHEPILPITMAGMLGILLSILVLNWPKPVQNSQKAAQTKNG